MSEILLHSMEPLSLPGKRTEDENRALQWALGAMMHTESHSIGKRTDENGVEHEVWQHTFTPSRPKPVTLKWLKRHWRSMWLDVKSLKRNERARKLKRRQRRAAQRRHNKGMS